MSETPAKGDKPAKLMVHKFLVWKTNKEGADPRYPAYVLHHTDYSSARAEALKRDVRVSSDRDQILALLGAGIAESVMSAPKDGGEPTLKRGWQEA